ncbi:MAG: response regulator, partial [Nitrospirae bacterium]|nr:response regulator [Nitrospirota bacterium]
NHTVLVSRNGGERVIADSGSPIRDSEGKVIGVVLVFRDITERKKSEAEREKLEAQLRHSQKMEAIGTLAGGVAHDFNNILTAIMGYGGLAQMNVNNAAATQKYIQEMLDAANRAGDLTKRLLVFSRKQVIEPVLADLNDIVRNIEKMLRRIMREDIELSTVLSAGELPVLVDVGQIEQVLMNLVANARDAMPDGGHLVIQTDVANVDSRYAEAHIFENTGMHTVLTVSDTGVGMDQGTKESIFEPFFTTKEVGKGTGLGLSMVYGIIRQHNGNINVYSEVGKGTTFKIYLPLAQIKKEALSKPIQILPEGKGETIIIAEDEPQVRKSISLLLQENGYKIIEAENGEDALMKFRENRGEVSLVLLDVIMPVKNGREAYEEIKAIEPGIRTIFMSGYTDDIIAKKGILEEGFDFISKPIDFVTLMRKIRDVLDR